MHLGLKEQSEGWHGGVQMTASQGAREESLAPRALDLRA